MKFPKGADVSKKCHIPHHLPIFFVDLTVIPPPLLETKVGCFSDRPPPVGNQRGNMQVCINFHFLCTTLNLGTCIFFAQFAIFCIMKNSLKGAFILFAHFYFLILFGQLYKADFSTLNAIGSCMSYIFRSSLPQKSVQPQGALKGIYMPFAVFCNFAFFALRVLGSLVACSPPPYRNAHQRLFEKGRVEPGSMS